MRERKIPDIHSRPLAFKMRPQVGEEFIGFSKLIKKYSFLNLSPLPSMIFEGPPGSGKTTLAHLLAKESNQDLYELSAVLNGVAELKQIITKCQTSLEQNLLHFKESKRAIIFIDEIHRFNKAQQDALLPSVESGQITLIGATTENVKFSINPALLSRTYHLLLPSLTLEELIEIGWSCLKRELEVRTDSQMGASSFEQYCLEYLASYADGDARKFLSSLELYIQKREDILNKSSLTNSVQVRDEELQHLVQQTYRKYDRSGDRHYDITSAFIKSLRGSDPDAALLYFTIMLDGGEDPLFIARRMMILASEDIGNADPMALMVATSALQAIQMIGLPEAAIILSQVVTYLASAPKSNASYIAMDEAKQFLDKKGTPQIPPHLKNHSKNYLYPHQYKNHFIKQNYFTSPLPTFYRPSENGREKFIKEWLKNLWGKEKYSSD